MIIRGFPNIITSDLAATKAWYVDLFGWTVEFDSDWFVHLKAPDAPGVELGLEIVQEPRDLFYGQRRMILRDPAGTLIDVSSACEPSQAFMDSLG